MHTATVTSPPRAPRDALRAQLHTNTFLYAVWGGGGIFSLCFFGVFFDGSHKLLCLEFSFTLSAEKLHSARCCLGYF